MKEIALALTYDDVLLKPKKSSVASRRDVDTATELTSKIKLRVPIVSANMDTVTEARMAIEMAKFGGIGIIHRFLKIDEQVKEVVKVKRWANYVIELPEVISDQARVSEVVNKMEESGVGGIIVMNKSDQVMGIVSNRDVKFENADNIISKVMTPWNRLVTASPGIDLDKAKELLHQHRIEKLPLVDGNRKLAGLITLKDIEKSEKFPMATKDEKGRLRVGAAIGVGDDFLERSRALVNAGCDVLVLDIAHGHLDVAISTLRKLRRNFSSVEIIAGNVATFEGAKDLVSAGADAVKVGVGPGSMCITRVVTGFGVPQLTAVMETVRFCAKNKIPVIADGGIRNSGDIVKALAAGASTVMLGGLLAGTDEAPGFPIIKNGRKYKVTRGMASLGANVGRNKRENAKENTESYSEYVAEGVEALVPYKGSVHELVHSLVGGVRSGMSYCGAKNVKDMWKKAEFMRITNAGIHESKPHDVVAL